MVKRKVRVRYAATGEEWQHPRILEAEDGGEFALQITPCNPMCDRCREKLIFVSRKLWESGFPGQIKAREMEGGWISHFLCLRPKSKFVIKDGTAKKYLRQYFDLEVSEESS
jgi:hypothetical protein